MTILLLGNGFDRTHGLPTQYTDFLDFMKWVLFIRDNDIAELGDGFKAWSCDVSIKKYITHIPTKESACSEEICALADNYWLRYFDKQRNNLLETWIDFELEISKVVRLLNNLKNEFGSIDYNTLWRDNRKVLDKFTLVTTVINDLHADKKQEFNKAFDELPSNASLEMHINVLKDLLKMELDNLIRCLEIYLDCCVNKLEVNPLPLFQELHVDRILSFNYTNTYHNLYHKTNFEENEDTVDEYYDFIHGKAEECNCKNNMVLGIDEYLSEPDKNTDLMFIYFKKYFQRIYKATGSKYRHWLADMRTGKQLTHYLIIYGHSLNITDGDILKDLIKEKGMITVIFYRNDDDLASKITNLVQVLTQEYLLENVYGKNPTIRFVHQDNSLPIIVELQLAKGSWWDENYLPMST